MLFNCEVLCKGYDMIYIPKSVNTIQPAKRLRAPWAPS